MFCFNFILFHFSKTFSLKQCWTVHVLSAHTQLEPRVVDMSQEMHCGCIKKTSKLCHTLARHCTCWLSGSWKCMSVHGAHTRPSSNAAVSLLSIRFSVSVRSWGVKSIPQCVLWRLCAFWFQVDCCRWEWRHPISICRKEVDLEPGHRRSQRRWRPWTRRWKAAGLWTTNQPLV